LFQGGQISETAMEAAKARYRDMLERGDVEGIEASLCPGMNYVVQVRALAELGTDDAGRILERQLQRRLTEDKLEQSWYWIDLASSLRTLNRAQSLPHLLRCIDGARDAPLGHFLTAEAVCFLSFAGYLRQHDTALGKTSLLALHRTLEGLRMGLPPVVVAEGRLGELVESVWDNRPEKVHPLVARIFIEALRVQRRASHFQGLLSGEGSELETFTWQMSHLTALEPMLTDYLQEAPALLIRELGQAPPENHRDILLALIDLRADTGTALLPLVEAGDYPHRALLLEALTWSKSAEVGPRLRLWALEHIPIMGRSQSRPRAQAPRKPSLPEGGSYRALLRSQRGHPSAQTESFLVLASRDWDPTYRAAAISSLGWWEPIERGEVLLTLQDARRDPNAEVRQAARAALARLGERQALQWFRHLLSSEAPLRVMETIHFVASEGIYLLWPDLDRIADAEDVEMAHQAREALERLCEEMSV
jgi:hypothetical protein